MQGWIAKDAAVTQSSSAPAAFAGCLYDVHQQSICRPKDPGNGDSTKIGFNRFGTLPLISQMCRVSDLKLEAWRQPALVARMRPPGQTSRKRTFLGVNKRRAGPKGA